MSTNISCDNLLREMGVNNMAEFGKKVLKISKSWSQQFICIIYIYIYIYYVRFIYHLCYSMCVSLNNKVDNIHVTSLHGFRSNTNSDRNQYLLFNICSSLTEIEV